MGLLGTLAKLQKAGANFYLSLAQRFNANNLIRDTWIAMSHDMECQTVSLKLLPGLFWKRLKDVEEPLLDAVSSCPVLRCAQVPPDRQLNSCFERTLDYEEPLILRGYAPLIRRLRVGWTDHALDFYIMVKAHVARLPQIIQPFSGNPTLIQRATGLLTSFEREVQMPEKVALPARARAADKKCRTRRTRKRNVFIADRRLPLRERAKRLARRTKPLVRAIKLARRRARR